MGDRVRRIARVPYPALAFGSLHNDLTSGWRKRVEQKKTGLSQDIAPGRGITGCHIRDP